jgi:hypothetical protein
MARLDIVQNFNCGGEASSWRHRPARNSHRAGVIGALTGYLDIVWMALAKAG